MMEKIEPQQLPPLLPLAEGLPVSPIHVLVAGGFGQVGGALLKQLASRAEFLKAEYAIDLVVHAVLSTRKILWYARNDSVDPQVEPRIAAEDWTPLEHCILEEPTRRWLFLDCTASSAVTEFYPWLLKHRVGVIAANKIANAADLKGYLALRQASRSTGAPFLYETNVGAGLPVLRTIADLRASGDRVRALEAVLSGTMSFLFEALDKDLPFSTAVRRARQLGFTEPHPYADLSGEDAARKLLIMLREAGLALERHDIKVEPLLPAGLDAMLDADAFLAALERVDETWRTRVASARAAGRYLTQLAYFDGEHARIGTVEVARDDAFAHLQSGENLLRLTTERYLDAPLVVAGPGAGPEVTAAGLVGDVIQAARLIGNGSCSI